MKLRHTLSGSPITSKALTHQQTVPKVPTFLLHTERLFFCLYFKSFPSIRQDVGTRFLFLIHFSFFLMLTAMCRFAPDMLLANWELNKFHIPTGHVYLCNQLVVIHNYLFTFNQRKLQNFSGVKLKNTALL